MDQSVICRSIAADCGLGTSEVNDVCHPGPKAGASTGLKNKSTYIAVGVAGAIVLIIVVLVIAYFVTKGRRKKLHLFSVFYDPTKQQEAQVRAGKGKGKGKGAQSIEMSEGVGNPVYDSFDDGRPLEDFQMSDVDTNMFVSDDAFAMPSEKGGATSMANPLYQDPYLEDDLAKY